MKNMKKINQLFLILIFTITSFNAQAACKLALEFGENISKLSGKYGPGMPMQFPEIKMIPILADELCPNEKLKDVVIEHRFFNDELAAVNFVALNDETNSVSEKLTLMKYVKKVYGNFDTGQNIKAYRGYEVFEKGKYFVVYQKTTGEENIINEEIYLSTDKYDKLLNIFYSSKEDEQAADMEKNNES